MEHERRYGESDARKVIDMYGAELALMAQASISANPDFGTPAAIIFEPGAIDEGSVHSALHPQVPLRVVEGGVSLAVVQHQNLRTLLASLKPRLLSYLDDERFSGASRLPILAICHEGFLMGSVSMPES